MAFDVAVFTNQGGGQGDTDIISVIDLKKNPPRIVESHSVGQIPEGATFSPDGSHVAITIQNGSNRPKTHQSYNDHGLVMVYRVEGGKLTFVAQAKAASWAQGVAWSRNVWTLTLRSRPSGISDLPVARISAICWRAMVTSVFWSRRSVSDVGVSAAIRPVTIRPSSSAATYST